MTKLRSVGAAAVFLMGCAVGGGASAFVVPKASAQQAATLTRWEYFNAELDGNQEEVRAQANKLGAEGWELTATVGFHGAQWCWYRRPKM